MEGSINNISYILVIMPNFEGEFLTNLVDVDAGCNLVVDSFFEA